MSKSKSVGIKTPAIVIKSVQDLGYQWACHIEGDAPFLAYAVSKGWNLEKPETIPDETVTQFKIGTVLRFSEMPQHAPKTYKREGNEITLDPKGGFTLSVAYAATLARHDLAQLPKDSSLGKEVRRLREKAKEYADMRWSRFLSAFRTTAIESGTAKPRASNKLFKEYLNKFKLDVLAKRKTCASNGDPTICEEAALRVWLEACPVK